MYHNYCNDINLSHYNPLFVIIMCYHYYNDNNLNHYNSLYTCYNLYHHYCNDINLSQYNPLFVIFSLTIIITIKTKIYELKVFLHFTFPWEQCNI